MDVKEKLTHILTSEPEMLKNLNVSTIKLYRLVDKLIANGVTAQEWISVKDRLPEEDGKYLVFEQSRGRTNTSILHFAKDARKVDRYDFKGRWKNVWYEYDSEWGHYTVNSVTHWQYLPQPPKGE